MLKAFNPSAGSNVALLRKVASPVGAMGRADLMRPARGRRRGAVDDVIGGLSLSSLQSERDRLHRLLNTYRYDIDVFSMVRAVMRRIPPWTLVETVPGQGDTDHQTILNSFFHLPDGLNTCQQITRCTIARMKMLGKAHWVLRRLVEEDSLDGGALALQRNLINALSKQLGVDPAEANAAVQDMFGANAPIGFELLDGAVRYNSKLQLWEQSVGAYGRSKTFPKEDVIEFRVMDPSGGVMSELERLEAWSDASVRVFKLNSDAVKTGGMADLLIMLYGSNQKEVERIEALMEDRADPARTEDVWLPMITHSTAPEGQRVGIEQVELSRRDRESRGLEFDKSLRVRKAGTTGVPLQAVGEWQQVNRANMETADYILMQHEVLPWCDDFSGQVNEQILVDVFGYTDWQFGFEEVDLRGEEFAHLQDSDLLKNGALTPYDYWVKMHGEARADMMLKTLTEVGVDEQVVKMPWQYSGNKWTPITENIPVTFKPGMEEPVVNVPQPPIPYQTQPVESEGGSPDVVPANGPDVMTKALDHWQRKANDALRKIGVPYDPEASAAAWNVLPQQMYLSLDKALYDCTSVAEVSQVFRDARSVLSKATEKLEKVATPQHVLRSLASAIDEVFLARDSEAQRLIGERMREEPVAFETEVTEEPTP